MTSRVLGFTLRDTFSRNLVQVYDTRDTRQPYLWGGSDPARLAGGHGETDAGPFMNHKFSEVDFSSTTTMTAAPTPPARPGLPWRAASMAIAGATGALCRGFLYGLNNVEVTGLNNLLNILDRRRTQGADRGLLTVSNHVMVYESFHIGQPLSSTDNSTVSMILSCGESCL
jgi:monolysocardiolipin acyltransferase